MGKRCLIVDDLLRCNSCKQRKPATLEFFHPSKGHICGLAAQRCRACDSARNAARRNGNPAEKKRRQELRADPSRALQHLLRETRGKAKQRGLTFSITAADLAPLPTHCPVLGMPLTRLGAGAYAPSIDRIDNARGYEPDNVWIISWRANLLKRDATLVELKAMAKCYSAIASAFKL